MTQLLQTRLPDLGEIQFNEDAYEWHSSVVIPVLDFLIGTKWDRYAKSMVTVLEPSVVRILTTGSGSKMNAVTDRVTIYVDENLMIESIHQEKPVCLEDGIEDGHELSCQYDI